MVLALALSRPEPKQSHTQFSSGFLTGKELDPDFVDFNSVNRRYHFPARFYLPFRAAFGQIDSLSRSVAPLSGLYAYGRSNPLVFIDSMGLEEAEIPPMTKAVACMCEVCVLNWDYGWLSLIIEGALFRASHAEIRITECNGTIRSLDFDSRVQTMYLDEKVNPGKAVLDRSRVLSSLAKKCCTMVECPKCDDLLNEARTFGAAHHTYDPTGVIGFNSNSAAAHVLHTAKIGKLASCVRGWPFPKYKLPVPKKW